MTGLGLIIFVIRISGFNTPAPLSKPCILPIVLLWRKVASERYVLVHFPISFLREPLSHFIAIVNSFS